MLVLYARIYYVWLNSLLRVNFKFQESQNHLLKQEKDIRKKQEI